MTLKTTQLRDAITFALAVGTTAVAGTGAAFAQEGEQQATTLDRIEVTGSRIKRADIETSQPIFSLSRDDITAQGLTSVGDVIQNITANGSTLNSTFNNGGNGETRVNLRNLGSNRTLVLVNGRRWVGGTGLGGAVDLNTIPTAAVERIEVLKDGASTIYGSDAIAGVVNVILRQNFEGAEANAYLGQFDKGDGTRQSYDFTIGTTGDRFSAMLGFGYVKEEPVMAGDRYISKEPTYTTGNVFGSGTSPDGRFALCRGGNNAAARRCNGRQTNSDGGPRHLHLRRRQVRQPRPYVAGPGRLQLRARELPADPAGASLGLRQRLGRHHRRRPLQDHGHLQRARLRAAARRHAGHAGHRRRHPRPATVFISADSIYNPFGAGRHPHQPPHHRDRRSLVQPGRAHLRDGRRPRRHASTSARSTSTGKRATSTARTRPTTPPSACSTSTRCARRSARRSATPMASPIAAPRPQPTSIAGCVPINFLGGVGGITQDMLDFSQLHRARRVQLHPEELLRQHQRRTVRPCRPARWASRSASSTATKSGYDSPDALINSGSTTGNARTATAGGYTLDEAYLEFAIPVLADVPFAKLLDFSRGHALLGLQQLRRHAQQQVRFPLEADRRPDGPRQLVGRLPRAVDRRAVRRPGRLVPDPERPLQHRQLRSTAAAGPDPLSAEGVPAGGYQQDNQQIRITVGGNPDLQPEKSESYTFGFVYSPSYVEGLDISLDWWQIKLDDAITTIGGADDHRAVRQLRRHRSDLRPVHASGRRQHHDPAQHHHEHRWHARSKATT